MPNNREYITDIRAERMIRQIDDSPLSGHPQAQYAEELIIYDDGACAWIGQSVGDPQPFRLFSGRGGINSLSRFLPAMGDIKPLLRTLQTIKDLKGK